MTFDEAAKAILDEAVRRGYNRAEAIACLSTAIQESGLRAGVVSPNGKWVGFYQQDTSYPGRYDAHENYREFFNRLDKKRASSGASPDIWLNIFWLQQAPGRASAQLAYDLGRKAYLTEIKSRTGAATALYDRLIGGQPTGGTVPVSGDPTWLEDVLRPALGDRLKTLPGWKDSGVGGFMADIRGVMWHHTGNSRATAQSIRDGRPDLAGPLSQLHIAPDGTVTIVAVGPCNHAGRGGGFSWLPNNDANRYTIGIECAWPTPNSKFPQGYDPAERWPNAQIIAMRDTGAALTKHLGVGVERNIGHKEWAGAAQGKWDPGNLDMNWFRGEIQKDIDGFVFPGETAAPVQPGPALPPDYAKEVWDQLRIEWPQLGGQTLVNAVAEIRDKVCGTNDRDKR